MLELSYRLLQIEWFLPSGSALELTCLGIASARGQTESELWVLATTVASGLFSLLSQGRTYALGVSWDEGVWGPSILGLLLLE